MVRLTAQIWGVLSLMAVPVSAECFGPGNLPSEVVWDDGDIYQIIDRHDDTVTIFYVHPDGTQITSQSLFGFYPEVLTRDGQELGRHEWRGDLVRPEVLDMSSVHRFFPTVTLTGNSYPAFWELRLLKWKTLKIEDCPYRVLKTEYVQFHDGSPDQPSGLRAWYSPDLRMILKRDLFLIEGQPVRQVVILR